MTEYEKLLRWREIVKRCVLLGCAKLDLWYKACEEVRAYEMRYNHNHDEKGRFCSGDGVDSKSDFEYNLYRREKNIGNFKELEAPMQMKYVKKVAELAGIDMNGIEVDIIRDPNMIGTGYFGYTFGSGKRIQLYPDAFTNDEALVKTIGHERVHCEQVKLFGKARSSDELRRYEKAAHFSEDYWWSNFKEAVKGEYKQ